MEMQYVEIDGHRFQGVKIPTGRMVILIIEAPKGFLGCGYLNIEAADKFQDVAAIVTGVKTIEELLEKPVQKVSKAAQDLGIKVGCSGKEALRQMM